MALSPETKDKRIKALDKRITVICDRIRKTETLMAALQEDLVSAKTDREWVTSAPVARTWPAPVTDPQPTED